MKLFTQYDYAKLLENGKLENHEKDHFPVVKLYDPYGHTWLITEICNLTHVYGLTHFGGFPCYDYFPLQLLLEVPGIKRDENFIAKYPISVYAQAARFNTSITEDDDILEMFVE